MVIVVFERQGAQTANTASGRSPNRLHATIRRAGSADQAVDHLLRFGLHVPDRKLRLFDRRKGRWGGRNPHDHVEMQPDARVARLGEGIEHLSYRDFAHHKRTIDSFTRIAAEAMAAEGKRGTPLDLLVRPPAVFVKSLLLKLGFLDGWRGFTVAAMAAYTDWKKYWRLMRQPRRAAGEAK